MTAAIEGKSGSVLLADIGGTNARFAVLRDGTLGEVVKLSGSDFATFDDAMTAALDRLPEAGTIAGAVFGVPGTIHDGRSELTNIDWVIDARELGRDRGWPVRLINDFQAVAYALPHLEAHQLRRIGGEDRVAGAPLAALGPGTGLGMAASIPYAGGHQVIATEGGHVTLAGTDAREDSVIAHLRQRFGHVSAERALSGDGLENLFNAITLLDGLDLLPRSAAEITGAALDGSCPTSRAALDMFCAMLGTVAGNQVLTLGATGGVFIAGGILPRIPDYLENSQFRERFEAKGRFRDYLAPVPIDLVLDDEVAFVGLRALAMAERP
jgi:glucokinase